MWLLGFYRFYLAVLAGGAFHFFVAPGFLPWLLVSAAVRTAWFMIEHLVSRALVELYFRRHIQSFKQSSGPYGIRIGNKAMQSRHIKNSLAEVFTPSRTKLEKTVEQLQLMDSLFRAGMRPEGDEYLLHDLKLKYGKHRLESEGSAVS